MKNLVKTFNLIHFRQWSRKNYAVLQSFSRLIKICSLNTAYTIILNGFVPVSAQTDSLQIPAPSFDIEEIEVIGQLNPTVFPPVARLVSIIPREEIDAAPVQSLPDLLEHLAFIDVSQRGANGVQADMTIRGGSFDHVMVLLNGVVISDPQTGHFNFDIPIDLEAIRRIEILSGPAARVYGPGAFTGAVNIVTKPGPDNYSKATITAGDHYYRRLSATASLKAGDINNLFNIGHSASAGYAANTDFSMGHIYYCGQYDKGDHSADIQAGYQQKAFGANGFYSPRYPAQYEENNTSLFSLNMKTGTTVVFQSSAYWRGKQDHYLLQRSNPGFYQNFHRNNVFGMQLTGRFTSGKSTATAGLGMRSENIISTRIGLDNPHPVKVRNEDSIYYSKHYNRSSLSYFQEQVLDLGKLSVAAGIMINWYSDFSDKPACYPGLDINYSFTKGIRTFISLNRTLRFPTFTDMFYTDPSHQGNQFLEPDRMISAEAGMHAEFSVLSASIALHRSAGKDIIDWLWLNESNQYSPVNIERMTTTGIEIMAALSLQEAFSGHSPLVHVALGYNYLDVDKSIPRSVAKYYNLKHKLTFSFRNKIFRNISSAWYLSYQDRMGSTIRYDDEKDSYAAIPYRPFLLIDGNLSWETKRVTFFVESSNLLDCRYVDAGSVIQPGRWIKAGIRVNMVFKGNKCKFGSHKQP